MTVAVVAGRGVGAERRGVVELASADSQVLAGWVVLTSSLLLPVAVLVVSYPKLLGLGG